MLARFLVFSALGWALEVVGSDGPKYSKYVPFKLPFRPIYGVGGLCLGAVAEAMKSRPLLTRVGAYALTVTTVELAACWADRALGNRSWSYDGGVCVDEVHTAVFTTLAVLTEPWLMTS